MCIPKNFPFTEKNVASLISPIINNPFVFLESSSSCKDQRSFLFHNFEDFLVFNLGDSIDLFFTKVENYLKSGFWLCGFFSYEAGYLFEDSLNGLARLNNKFPLIWLGVSSSPLIVNHNFMSKPLSSDADLDLSYELANFKPNVKKSEYDASIAKIKNYIEEGLTYQVNYTFKYKFDFKGSALGLYLNLRRNQPTSYSAFINTGNRSIISLSPELFFKISEDNILTKPMKGTLSRGFSNLDDKNKANWLAKDIKNRAENLMIVDLLRNDLGRVSDLGSVKVRNLFQVERYRTLHQMVSTVESVLNKNVCYKELFRSLFPSGSVTGAPKISTMKIIRELEREPRYVYTGSIGYISPEREACFNVAIRTVLLDKDKAEMGIGGGITYDSLDNSEYKEAILKADFLNKDFSDFNLIETIRWDRGRGYYLIEEHINRISNSALYFQIPLNVGIFREKLSGIEKEFKEDSYRVRLILDMEGNIKTEFSILDNISCPVRVKISSIKIDPNDVYLYHKTTRRGIYNEERKSALREGFFDVLYTNIEGEFTEGAISNLFLSIEGKLYTPPLRCGLLPGVLRGELLSSGRVYERVLNLEDAKCSDRIFMGNSVRGLLEANLKIG